jgi:uridine phosphorylase
VSVVAQKLVVFLASGHYSYDEKKKMFLRAAFLANSRCMTSRAMHSSSVVASNKFSERERAFEESFVRKHEQEALSKLREKIQTKAPEHEVNKSLDELQQAMKLDDKPTPAQDELLKKISDLEKQLNDLKSKAK